MLVTVTVFRSSNWMNQRVVLSVNVIKNLSYILINSVLVATCKTKYCSSILLSNFAEFVCWSYLNSYLTCIICLLSCRFDGKPEDVLNPKKKQLDKITPVSIYQWPILCDAISLRFFPFSDQKFGLSG
jgi:hypothetical protein